MFGRHITFSHIIRPVYLTLKTKEWVHSTDTGMQTTFFTRTVEVDIKPRLVANDKMIGEHGDIGAALPGSASVPASGEHRRARRFARPGQGIIIGRTWIAEGQYQPADIEDQPYLSESGRVPVYQVALPPAKTPGEHSVYAVDIVNVHKEDIT